MHVVGKVGHDGVLLMAKEDEARPFFVGSRWKFTDQDYVSLFASLDLECAGAIFFDGTGVLTKPEMSRIFARFGLIDQLEVDKFFAKCAYEQSKAITPDGLFRMIDTDGSGTIDRGELSEALKMMGLEVAPRFLDSVWSDFEKEGISVGGQISLSEFAECLSKLTTTDEGAVAKNSQRVLKRLMEHAKAITFDMFKTVMQDVCDSHSLNLAERIFVTFAFPNRSIAGIIVERLVSVVLGRCPCLRCVRCHACFSGHVRVCIANVARASRGT